MRFENEFHCRGHVLRTDGGGEYINVDLFCKQTGVRRQITEIGSRASNGKAERMNRTIFNMVRCMNVGHGVPLVFWSEAAEYGTYILNRSPTRSNPGRVSPIQMLTNETTSVSNVVVFGSPCMVWRDSNNKSFAKHAERALILENNDETKGYKVLFLKDRVVTTTRHVSQIGTLTEDVSKQISRTLECNEEVELENLAQERHGNANVGSRKDEKGAPEKGELRKSGRKNHDNTEGCGS